MESKDLHQLITERQTKRQFLFDKFQEKFENASHEERQIWENTRKLNFNKLIESLQNGQITALQAVNAYQYQTLIAQMETNCVTQFIEEAESQAKELDLKYSESRKPPLFGVPFSVKEHIQVKGYDATCGLARRLGIFAEEDCVLVKILRDLGAIPFVITNFPQFNGSFTCSNPIYGRTTHPLNRDRTPGGSSGGEGALISMGGAPFGIGSDGGGSIRIPASFCGIAGLKPTASRLSMLGAVDVLPGVQAIGITGGPMAKDVDTLVTVMRHWLSGAMSVFDPYMPVMPFRDNLFNENRPLTIGYYDHDGWFEPVPANRRAVHLVKNALKVKGHRLVSFQPDRTDEIAVWFGTAFIMDGGNVLLEKLDADIPDELHSSLYTLYRVPYWIKRLACWLLGRVYPRMGKMAKCFSQNSADLRHVHTSIDAYRVEFVRKWKEAELDCLICPAFAHPAPPHELPIKCSATLPYTALYNVLDFPAGVVPVTQVSEQDQIECAHYSAIDLWGKDVKMAFCSDSLELPVGVQCVALPNNDEICLNLMKQVEQVVKDMTAIL